MVETMTQQKQWAKIIAKSWVDEDFKAELMANPAAVLKQEGIEIPEGVELKCVEATDAQQYLILPPKPEGNITMGEERLAASSLFSGSGGR